MQYIFIYRAVYDCLNELLKTESTKAEQLATSQAEQQALRDAAEAADRAKQEEEERERAAIEEARKALEREELARGEASAAQARAIISLSLSERKSMLQAAEEQWLINYQQSLAEWNDRNQFAAEQYDTTSELTPVQSRLEALRQKGMLI
ncbi:uncharacterized protein MONBRDRAFT_25249 [Monosiga brevicollis MX1]|uniref:Uncharacterized protein n=1 Tax=Monosiga brevicollis TaxID=81824 RepID=A9UYU8_MONBE|nr:uncharacterized protein MONBRDRAFT_25249 [Monosiga brevicollis MX1]EDQ89669.1 predicted protein [Monosiga brevicollis MX1]|eukprot:XP_001745698.1 hypothetical protein [Monosiga brevicollis MX1]